ncbi:MAG: sugar phosphate isomerase/epimerase family protein [Bacteroidota bacterium]
MELCLNQATIMQCDTEEFIKVSARAGFKWLELRIPKVEEFLIKRPARELAQIMRSAGVRVATLNALEFFSLVPEENYKFMEKKAEEAAVLCQLLDCEWMIAVPSRKNACYTGERAVAETTAARLAILAEIAERYGIKVLFEFIGFPDFSVTDLNTAAAIADMVKKHEIKLVIDTFHYYVGGTRLDDLLATAADRLGIIHVNDLPDVPFARLNDGMRLLPGEGRADLSQIQAGLKKIGFGGRVSLELFNEELWRATPQEAADLSWRSMQQFA